jgi:hypothetical protein
MGNPAWVSAIDASDLRRFLLTVRVLRSVLVKPEHAGVTHRLYARLEELMHVSTEPS